MNFLKNQEKNYSCMQSDLLIMVFAVFNCVENVCSLLFANKVNASSAPLKDF